VSSGYSTHHGGWGIANTQEGYTYFQLFDVTGILAYAIAFILVVQAIEIAILQPWEAAASRWRR
jgi:hypothetical protein